MKNGVRAKLINRILHNFELKFESGCEGGKRTISWALVDRPSEVTTPAPCPGYMTLGLALP